MKRIMTVVLFMIAILAKGYTSEKEVPLKRYNKGNTDEYTIPIGVTLDQNHLVIELFKGLKQVNITVVSFEGEIVYQREVTIETYKAVMIDLTPYKEGGYTIYFRDEKGELIEGDFWVEGLL